MLKPFMLEPALLNSQKATERSVEAGETTLGLLHNR
jgi:hypothetical protein